MKKTLFFILLFAFVSACRDDDKKGAQTTPVPRPAPQQTERPTLPQPPPTQVSGWQWVHPSGGRACPLSQEGEWTTFQFEGCEPHQLLRQTNPLPTNGRVKLSWTCGDCQVHTRKGGPGKVSLIIVRDGNDWSGNQPNHRFYWAGQPLGNGGGEIEVPFDPGLWTNVFGQNNPSGFLDTLAHAAWIGQCYGNPDTGDTCHGLNGKGKYKFLFRTE